jgi:hypothetical protein
LEIIRVPVTQRFLVGARLRKHARPIESRFGDIRIDVFASAKVVPTSQIQLRNEQDNPQKEIG